MASEARARRLAERIREELAELLLREVADPRLALVSVTDVEVDREFSMATIYVSALDGPSTGSRRLGEPKRLHRPGVLPGAQAQRVDEILEALRRARGFLRHELAQRIPVRSFPQLRFRYDPSAERGAHIEELIASLHPPPGPKKTPRPARTAKAKRATRTARPAKPAKAKKPARAVKDKRGGKR